MTALTARPIGPALAEPKPKPNSVFLQLVFIYVVLQCFAFAFESGLFKLLSGAFAFVVFGVAVVNAVFLSAWRTAPRTMGIGLPIIVGFTLYYAGMLGSLVINRGATDIQEWAKIFMAPAFLLCGYVFACHDRSRPWDSTLLRGLFVCLAVLPLLVWASQLLTGRTALGGGYVVGVFANRNNAGLYCLVLLAFFGQLRWQPVQSMLVFLLVGVAFGTMGVLMATVLAVLLAMGKVRYIGRLLAALVLVVLLAYLLPENFAWARLQRVVLTTEMLLSGRIDLRNSTYADLVLLLRTNDLSFIFRLKHWTELWDLWLAGPWHQMLFGHGVGGSVRLSSIHLVPHNDYVRYLFECGLLTLAGFLLLLWVPLLRIGRRWEMVPLLAVAIYFFSENLINNYLAMAVFYFSVGATLYRVRHAAAVDAGKQAG
jgi:hypothetical protein